MIEGRSCSVSAGQRQHGGSALLASSMRVHRQADDEEDHPATISRICSSNRDVDDDDESSAAMARCRPELVVDEAAPKTRTRGTSAEVGWGYSLDTTMRTDGVKWLCSLHHYSVANAFCRRRRHMKVLYTVLCLFLMFKDLGVIVTCSDVESGGGGADDSFNFNATLNSPSGSAPLDGLAYAEPGDVRHYTAMWAVHIPGGELVADEVARRHGFVNYGRVSDLR